MKRRFLFGLLACVTIAGCFSDASSKKVYGKYYITPIHGSGRGLSYEIADGAYLGRIKGNINAVQAMGDTVLLVEQWEGNQKQYFAIDMKRDRDIVEPAEIILGPMDRQGFLRYYSNHFREEPLELVAVRN